MIKKEYRTILMDPPWNESGGGKIKRGADKHYSLIKPKDMLPTIIKGLNEKGSIADDAHCYMWVTNNFLKDGLQLMQELGFRYITNIVWVKDRFGLGQYFRGQHELMLFGVKGKFHRNKIPDSSCASVIHAKRRKHSQKPIEQYTRIESISAGPYLEMFARNKKDNWDVWGNQSEETDPKGQTTLI